MMRRAWLALVILAVALSFGLPTEAQVRQRDHTKKKRGNGHKVKVRDHAKKKRGNGHKVKVRDHTKGKRGRGPKVRERDHTRRPPRRVGVAVSGFSPRAGRIGTVVTIRGRGFAARTKIFVGGRPARRVGFTPVSVTFAVPARPRDGLIILRHPGVPRDIVVGKFELIADPRITRISPLSGPVGTRVELQGSGFRARDQVLLTGTRRGPAHKTLVPISLTPNRITVSIPPGATTGFFVVRRAGSRDARSRRPFRVIVPPPTLSGFSPRVGPPGTVVRLTGEHFGNGDRVFYGRQPVLASNRGPGFIDVTIPARARRSERLQIRGPRGTVTARQAFDLVVPPRIVRFAPSAGAAGTKVTIFGQNFRPGDKVRLGTSGLRIFTLEPTALVVEIPAGARNAPLTLVRRGVVVSTARRPFTVLVRPSISGFAPSTGPPGTRVVIKGSGLSPRTTVFYGAQKLRIKAWREDAAGGSLEVQVPANAKDHTFVVRTAGGEVTSRMAFHVFRFSALTGVSPTRGPVGTLVRLRGRSFDARDTFTLAGQQLPVTERHPNEVVVSIPGGAGSGRIGWTSHGRTSQSRFVFTVLNPPQFHSMTPMRGPAGTRVVIRGMRFTKGTEVLYGPRRMQISRRHLPTELTVVIPATARVPAFLTVVNGPERARSKIKFKVLLPPVVRRMRPNRGPAGSVVTLIGARFSQQTRVTINNVVAPIVQRIGSVQLKVRVPPGVRGRHPFVVEDRGMTAVMGLPFTVLGPPPRPTPPPRRPYAMPALSSRGKTVIMVGNFRGVTKGQLQARWSGASHVLPRTLTATQATFVVPAKAKTGFCSVKLRRREVWRGQCRVR